MKAVWAIDPSESFVAAVRERLPEVDVRHGVVEELPFPDDSFDLTLAQLVVHFMADPARGIAEMARVTRARRRRGGMRMGWVPRRRRPVATFWQAARDLDPAVPDESERSGSHDGQLVALFDDAGLRQSNPRN